MKQFEIEGKIFNLKNKWEDLVMNDYIEFQKLERSREFMSDEDYIAKFLNILSNVEESDVMNIELDLLYELMESIEINKVNMPPSEVKFIEMGGDKWAFKSDFQKLTMGEYVSIKTFQENVKDDLESLLLIISVLMRKVVSTEPELVLEKYNPEYTNKIVKLIRTECKVVDIYHYINFFFAGKKNYTLRDTQAFSMVEELKQKSEPTK